LNKEADLLCGDAIINYKTIQSFGHEDVIVKKYTEYLQPAYKASKIALVKGGFFFGLSQLTQFGVFAVMFWSGGKLITVYSDMDDDGNFIKLNINPDDIFGALFSIMFAGF
jgi:ABC-type transport system involved in Fe-S cluster assembly fused permease/ATPase subunit